MIRARARGSARLAGCIAALHREVFHALARFRGPRPAHSGAGPTRLSCKRRSHPDHGWSVTLVVLQFTADVVDIHGTQGFRGEFILGDPVGPCADLVALQETASVSMPT